MAKAKIVSVEVMECGYKVVYDSGSVKSYKDAPKSVLTFLESTQSTEMETPADETKDEPLTVSLAGSTQDEPLEAPADEVKAEPLTVSPTVSTESEDEEAKADEVERVIPSVRPIISTQAGELTSKASKAKVEPATVYPIVSTQCEDRTVKASEVIKAFALVGLDAFWALADVAGAVWIFLTTYILIGWDRLAINAPVAGAWMKKARAAVWTWVKAFFGWALGWVLGWGLAGILAGAGALLTIYKAFRAGQVKKAELLAA